jgi:peptidoglycan/xylan/chitin deacetylase (PgdA/CDA1 family)
MLINKIYYNIKPIIPRPLQLYVRCKVVAYKRKKYSHIWPIDPAAAKPPKGWKGWPDKKKFALVLSHDVDTEKGHNKCYELMDIEESLGFRSSFNFVPERYNVSKRLRHDLVDKGFEVGVHGLIHDGKLFSNKEVFQKRAIKIHQYIKEYKAVGFRAPSMHHNLNWIHELNLEYDASTFDTDPFEPQSDGIGTIFPFWVKNSFNGKGYVELPYTLVQDFTLFILMKEQNIDIWKKKLDWIAEKGGMALFNAHPDYMNFNKQKNGNEEYAVERYVDILEHIKGKYKDQYWHALPKDIARFWKQNYSHL